MATGSSFFTRWTSNYYNMLLLALLDYIVSVFIAIVYIVYNYGNLFSSSYLIICECYWVRVCVTEHFVFSVSHVVGLVGEWIWAEGTHHFQWDSDSRVSYHVPWACICFCDNK